MNVVARPLPDIPVRYFQKGLEQKPAWFYRTPAGQAAVTELRERRLANYNFYLGESDWRLAAIELSQLAHGLEISVHPRRKHDLETGDRRYSLLFEALIYHSSAVSLFRQEASLKSSTSNQLKIGLELSYFSQALGFLRQAHPDFHNAVSTALMIKARSEAVEIFTRLNSDRDAFYEHAYLGHLYLGSDDLGRAVNHISQALEIGKRLGQGADKSYLLAFNLFMEIAKIAGLLPETANS